MHDLFPIPDTSDLPDFMLPRRGGWSDGIALRSDCAWCGREIGAYVPHLVNAGERVCAPCAAYACPPETVEQSVAAGLSLHEVENPPAPFPF